MSLLATSFAWVVALQAQAAAVPEDVVAEISESGRSTVAAKAISRAAPKYPGLELRQGRQAWVHVAYCIDESGQPQNVSVLDSVGSERFDRAAIQTVESWEYEPALVDGVPTWQSRNEVYISFALEDGNKGGSPGFVRTFKKIGRLIDAGDYDAAAELFDKTHGSDKLSLYELTKLWAQRVRIEAARGDFTRLRMALQRATASDGKWIDKESYLQLMSLLVKVEVSMGHYASSLYSYRKLVKAAGDEHEFVQQLRPGMAEVRALADGDTALSISAKIHSSADCLHCSDSWNFRPIRRRLTLANVQGQLDSIEMRCDHKRFTSEVSDAVEWHIPESWGSCRVHIYGEPGTRFDVYELPPE